MTEEQAATLTLQGLADQARGKMTAPARERADLGELGDLARQRVEAALQRDTERRAR